jgi:hypothetical protein
MKVVNKHTKAVIWEYAVEVPNTGVLVTDGIPYSVDNPSLEVGLITLDENMILIHG